MEKLLSSEILLELLLTFLYLVPISIFRYLPFHNKFRFSAKGTILFYFLFFLTGNLILVSLGMYDSFTVANRYRFVFYIFMTLFSFFLVKDHMGKQFYVICFYANYSFLFSAATLIPEALIFGRQSYHLWFKAIAMLVVLLFAMPLIYHFSFKPLTSIIRRDIPGVWRILWLAGLIQLLLNAFLSIPYQTEDILISKNAFIRLSISIGSILLNHTILYLIKGMLSASDKNLALEAEKQQLMIQEYQYRSLQAHIEQSRRFRHDFKQHSAVISSIAADVSLTDAGKLEKLTSYCQEYFGTIPEAEEKHFCEHYPLNLILNYYDTKITEAGCSFTAKVNVPPHVAIPDTELCVVVGNLLINAMEGVEKAPEAYRQVIVNITKEGANFLILVENGFDGQLNQSLNTFHSTKHSGEGIGIPSIRNIVSKYHGTCYFDHEDRIFSARIHLYLEY